MSDITIYFSSGLYLTYFQFFRKCLKNEMFVIPGSFISYPAFS